MNRSAVLNTLKIIISEAIEMDPSEVGQDSSLIDDLGIESVDMLYIKSKVESEFNIEWDFVSDLINPELVQDGKITAQGAARLKEHFLNGEFKDVQPGTSVIDIIGKFTVNSMVISIFNRLERELE